MTIGIIGSGAMGAGIAQVAATAGHPVRLLDQNPAALEQARAGIEASLRKLTAKGKLTAEAAAATLARLHCTEAVADFADCGLVIEAIVEDLAVKQQVFKQVEEVVSAACTLASNTSSLSITAIAAACRRPERLLGIHFFNPAPLMRLVEIIPAAQTRAGLAEETKALVASWNKTPVLAQDTPGFLVNRVARPFYGEALRILEEGIADAATIDWALTELGGFRMGPFALMDFIGHDVNFRVTEAVYAGFFLRCALPARPHPAAAAGRRLPGPQGRARLLRLRARRGGSYPPPRRRAGPAHPTPHPGHAHQRSGRCAVPARGLA